MFSTRKLICLLIISYLLLMSYASYHLFKYVRYISCTSYLIISLCRFPSWFIVYADAVILEGEAVFARRGGIKEEVFLLQGIFVEASVRVKLL